MRTRVVVPALVVAVVLALVVGITLGLSSRGSGSGDRGVVVADRGTATVAPAAPVARVAPPVAPPVASHRTKVAARPVLARRPSIVLVLMDDFSLDLRRHDARGGDDAARGRGLRARLRRRLAVLRLARQPAHRAVPPPDRRADQHRQHAQPGRAGRRLGGVRGLRQRGTQLPGPVAAARLHHRLRRQVPQPVRDPRRRRAAGAAGLGRLAGAVRRCLPGLGLPEHPTGRRTGPGRRASAAVRLGDGRREGRGLRRQRHR